MQQPSPLQQYCLYCLDGGGVFTLSGLSRQAVVANLSGIKKSAIIALLNDILQRLERAQRNAECEVVAELNQCIVSSFSRPNGAEPDEDPSAAGRSGGGLH